MGAPHKFLFDQSFDQTDASRPAVARKAPPPLPPEPTFSKAELDAAHTAGMEAGRATALVDAAQAAETRAADALAALSARLSALLAARDSEVAAAQRHAIEAMREVLRKLAPALSRKAPLIELEEFITQCLRDAFDEPRLVLRIADSAFEAVQQRLAALTAATAFAGKVVLLADETLEQGDARVEWAEGGAERDAKRLIHDIDGALARALDSIPVPGMSRPEENDHE